LYKDSALKDKDPKEWDSILLNQVKEGLANLQIQQKPVFFDLKKKKKDLLFLL
jgi:hypothetical protein